VPQNDPQAVQLLQSFMENGKIDSDQSNQQLEDELDLKVRAYGLKDLEIM